MEFIPRLIHGLYIRVKSVNLRAPPLNDLFLKLTGRTIRDEVLSDGKEAMREFVRPAMKFSAAGTRISARL